MIEPDVVAARLQRLEGWLAQDPRNSTLLADIFDAALAAGDTARAAALLLQARAASVRDGALDAMQSNLLRTLHRLRRLDEAGEWLAEQQEAGMLQPGAAAVASLIAIDRDDFAAARTWSDTAVAAGRSEPEALVARATVALAEQDAALATHYLERALELHPKDGRTWSTLGAASLLRGDAAAARSQFERATATLPQHVGTWHGLGWSCIALGDLAGALRAFEQALAADRNFAESHAALAMALLLAGRAAEGERHLAQAERLDRGNTTGRFARAWQRNEVQDPKSLRALARRLLDRPGFFGGRLADSLRSPSR